MKERAANNVADTLFAVENLPDWFDHRIFTESDSHFFHRIKSREIHKYPLEVKESDKNPIADIDEKNNENLDLNYFGAVSFQRAVKPQNERISPWSNIEALQRKSFIRTTHTFRTSEDFSPEDSTEWKKPLRRSNSLKRIKSLNNVIVLIFKFAFDPRDLPIFKRVNRSGLRYYTHAIERIIPLISVYPSLPGSSGGFRKFLRCCVGCRIHDEPSEDGSHKAANDGKNVSEEGKEDRFFQGFHQKPKRTAPPPSHPLLCRSQPIERHGVADSSSFSGYPKSFASLVNDFETVFNDREKVDFQGLPVCRSRIEALSGKMMDLQPSSMQEFGRSSHEEGKIAGKTDESEALEASVSALNPQEEGRGLFPMISAALDGILSFSYNFNSNKSLTPGGGELHSSLPVEDASHTSAPTLLQRLRSSIPGMLMSPSGTNGVMCDEKLNYSKESQKEWGSPQNLQGGSGRSEKTINLEKNSRRVAENDGLSLYHIYRENAECDARSQATHTHYSRDGSSENARDQVFRPTGSPVGESLDEGGSIIFNAPVDMQYDARVSASRNSIMPSALPGTHSAAYPTESATRLIHPPSAHPTQAPSHPPPLLSAISWMLNCNHNHSDWTVWCAQSDVGNPREISYKIAPNYVALLLLLRRYVVLSGTNRTARVNGEKVVYAEGTCFVPPAENLLSDDFMVEAFEIAVEYYLKWGIKGMPKRVKEEGEIDTHTAQGKFYNALKEGEQQPERLVHNSSFVSEKSASARASGSNRGRLTYNYMLIPPPPPPPPPFYELSGRTIGQMKSDMIRLAMHKGKTAGNALFFVGREESFNAVKIARDSLKREGLQGSAKESYNDNSFLNVISRKAKLFDALESGFLKGKKSPRSFFPVSRDSMFAEQTNNDLFEMHKKSLMKIISQKFDKISSDRQFNSDLELLIERYAEEEEAAAAQGDDYIRGSEALSALGFFLKRLSPPPDSELEAPDSLLKSVHASTLSTRKKSGGIAHRNPSSKLLLEGEDTHSLNKSDVALSGCVSRASTLSRNAASIIGGAEFSNSGFSDSRSSTHKLSGGKIATFPCYDALGKPISMRVIQDEGEKEKGVASPSSIDEKKFRRDFLKQGKYLREEMSDIKYMLSETLKEGGLTFKALMELLLSLREVMRAKSPPKEVECAKEAAFHVADEGVKHGLNLERGLRTSNPSALPSSRFSSANACASGGCKLSTNVESPSLLLGKNNTPPPWEENPGATSTLRSSEDAISSMKTLCSDGQLANLAPLPEAELVGYRGMEAAHTRYMQDLSKEFGINSSSNEDAFSYPKISQEQLSGADSSAILAKKKQPSPLFLQSAFPDNVLATASSSQSFNANFSDSYTSSHLQTTEFSSSTMMTASSSMYLFRPPATPFNLEDEAEASSSLSRKEPPRNHHSSSSPTPIFNLLYNELFERCFAFEFISSLQFGADLVSAPALFTPSKVEVGGGVIVIYKDLDSWLRCLVHERVWLFLFLGVDKGFEVAKKFAMMYDEEGFPFDWDGYFDGGSWVAYGGGKWEGRWEARGISRNSSELEDGILLYPKLSLPPINILRLCRREMKFIKLMDDGLRCKAFSREVHYAKERLAFLAEHGVFVGATGRASWEEEVGRKRSITRRTSMLELEEADFVWYDLLNSFNQYRSDVLGSAGRNRQVGEDEVVVK